MTVAALVLPILIPILSLAATDKAMPTDVTQLLDRAEQCQHWGGEEAYDKAREREISKAVAKLRCDSVENDFAKLKTKYRTNKPVLEKLKQAEESGD